MTAAIDVREATTDDAPVLEGVLARAFERDPCLSWVFRDDSARVDHLRLLFRNAIDLFVPYGISYTTADRSGVSLWAPPGRWRTPEEVVQRMAPVMAEVYGQETLMRLITFFGCTEEKHPDADHYYLAVLGSDQGRQGQGVGSANMRPVLERADAEGLPCYLESSNERNVPLYERHGFVITDVVNLPEDGPPIWLMWRLPR
jgi:ribosomal protein S18 acetylase RimI-like enzyme